MSCITCGPRTVFAAISKAAAKSAGDRLRRMGVVAQHPYWPSRATVCATCPLRIVRGQIAYCGEPFLARIDREPTEGCGCPITAKAKDPREHCPVDSRHRKAIKNSGRCTCKWCHAEAGRRMAVR